MSTSPAVFAADLARYDAALRAADAIRVAPDGFAWIDPRRVPEGLLGGYRRLIAYGYANGLIPPRTGG